MKTTISSDKSKLNVTAIHDFLCNRSYWAKGRSLERVKTSIENSICFGIYDQDENQLGFARLLTDKVVFAYLMDFFIFEEHRGQGLSKVLLKHILQQQEFQVRLWFLGTQDAHGLYEKFGFQRIPDPERFMYMRQEQYC